MQNLQPIHLSLSIRTMPSALLNVASTGQTDTQGGLSQCWQGLGMKYAGVLTDSCITRVLIWYSYGLRWWAPWHASTHFLVFLQCERSITNYERAKFQDILEMLT